MGTVIDLNSRRRRRAGAAKRPSQLVPPNMVCCVQCEEPHPIIRLQGGEERCVTAFFDGANWFCRNRGCRRAWLGATPEH